MSQPFSKITKIDANSKKKLIDYFNYSSIYEAKKQLKLPYANDVYQKLKNDYNRNIEQQQQTRIQMFQQIPTFQFRQMNYDVKIEFQLLKIDYALGTEEITTANKTIQLKASTINEISNKVNQYVEKYPMHETRNLRVFYQQSSVIEFIIDYRFTYQRNYEPVPLENVPMRASKPIKFSFLKYFKNISKYCYEDHENECVIKTLMNHLNLKNEKKLHNIILENWKEWKPKDGVTSLMLKHICEKMNINLLGLDQNEKCFIKHNCRSSNYKSIVFYCIGSHFYLISDKDAIKKLSATFKEGFLFNNQNEEEQQPKIEIIDDDKYFMSCLTTMNQVTERRISPFTNEKEILETDYLMDYLNENKGKTIITKKPLIDILNLWIKRYNDFPNVSYKSYTTLKSLHLNGVKIETEETYIEKDELKKICKNMNIDYSNQSISKLLTELLNHFYKPTKDEDEDDNMIPFLSSYNIQAYETMKSSFFNKCQHCQFIGDIQKNKPLHSIDFNKCRRNLLLNNDFPVYSVLDNIEPFYENDKIKCGFYYVEAEEKNGLNIFRTNEFYYYKKVLYGLEKGYIKKENIKYKYVSSLTFDNFEPFIKHILNNVECEKSAKLLINSLVGIFGIRSTNIFKNRVALTDNIDELACNYTMLKFPFENKIKQFTILVDKIENIKTTNYYPIYASILDMESVYLDKMVNEVVKLGREPVSVKTDSIQYYGDEIDVSNYYYEGTNTLLCKKEKGSLPIATINITKKNVYNYDEKNYKRCLEYDNTKGVFLTGLGGTGKTYFCNKLIEKLQKDGNEVIKLGTTNVSANLLEGMTIDKFQHINKKKLMYIFLDEISMLKEKFYLFLVQLKMKYKDIKIIMAGDYNQLKPVGERANFNYKNSRALYEIVDGNFIHLVRCMRSDATLFHLSKKVLEGNDEIVSKVDNSKLNYLNISFTNEKRKEINEKCMKRYMNEFQYTEKHFVKKIEGNNNSQEFVLMKGMPVITHKTVKKYDFCNNEFFKVKQITNNNIIVSNDKKELVLEKEIFDKYFNLAFCITTHKSQGLTIKEPYTIYEWDKFNRNMKYVAISRSSDINNITIM